jgi:hypothetical protein
MVPNRLLKRDRKAGERFKKQEVMSWRPVRTKSPGLDLMVPNRLLKRDRKAGERFKKQEVMSWRPVRTKSQEPDLMVPNRLLKRDRKAGERFKKQEVMSWRPVRTKSQKPDLMVPNRLLKKAKRQVEMRSLLGKIRSSGLNQPLLTLVKMLLHKRRQLQVLQRKDRGGNPARILRRIK